MGLSSGLPSSREDLKGGALTHLVSCHRKAIIN
jgi:hypothetical protein